MKLNAVGVTSKNLQTSINFYTLLGFQFPELKGDEKHVESIPQEGSAKLMIDSKELAKSIIGEDPRPSNHSPFCLEYNNSIEVNEVCQKVKDAGFKIIKKPWDAFWHQRYAIVEDPDGYKVDLYTNL